jgi:predicted DNA-binding transcriptional regulator YafY
MVTPLKFTYTNYAKVTAERTVMPIKVWFGKSPYHEDEQWFLEAYDTEKAVVRDFAMVDIRDIQHG